MFCRCSASFLVVGRFLTAQRRPRRPRDGPAEIALGRRRSCPLLPHPPRPGRSPRPGGGGKGGACAIASATPKAPLRPTPGRGRSTPEGDAWTPIRSAELMSRLPGGVHYGGRPLRGAPTTGRPLRGRPLRSGRSGGSFRRAEERGARGRRSGRPGTRLAAGGAAPNRLRPDRGSRPPQGAAEPGALGPGRGPSRASSTGPCAARRTAENVSCDRS
jgi:hypothetical protein